MANLPAKRPARRQPEVLQREIDLLRRENDQLRTQIHTGRRDQNPWSPVALAGAVIGLVGILGAATIGYVSTGDGNATNRQSVICEQAYMIVADDALNPALSPAQSRALVGAQLQILKKCERFAR